MSLCAVQIYCNDYNVGLVIKRLWVHFPTVSSRQIVHTHLNTDCDVIAIWSNMNGCLI